MRPPVSSLPLALPLVAFGGAAGSASRAAVTLALPGGPLAATLLVNVIGAFALAVLVVRLTGGGDRDRDRDRGRRRGLYLLLGTGFCGGFTTYSAVALQTAELLRGSAPVSAAGYALLTLAAGALATVAGLAVGASVERRSRRRPGTGVGSRG